MRTTQVPLTVLSALRSLFYLLPARRFSTYFSWIEQHDRAALVDTRLDSNSKTTQPHYYISHRSIAGLLKVALLFRRCAIAVQRVWLLGLEELGISRRPIT